jgi:MFS family permease
VGIVVASGIGAALVTRTGVKWLLVAGLLLVAVGLLLMARLPDNGTYVANILPAFVVTAFGAGMVFLPMTNAAVSGAGPQDAGLASGLLNTSQQVGGAVGLALLSTIATSYTNSVMHSDAAAGLYHALVAGFDRSFVVAACLVLAAAVVTILTISPHVGKQDRLQQVPSPAASMEGAA